MATIITLTQKKASSSKAQPLEIEPIIIEVPADTADAPWKRIEVTTNTSRWTVGKGQLHLHIIHPHKVLAYYCNSLWPDIPGSLAHICKRKQNLKASGFPMISFLLHSVSQCSRTVKWDHCHGQSGRSEPLLTKWLERWCPQSLPAQNNENSKSLELFISSSCSLLMLPGCQGSFDHCTRRQPCKLMNPKRGRITLLSRAHPAQEPQAMAITGLATCLRVVFFPPVFYFLVPPLGLLMWIIFTWAYGMLSIMAGSFPNPLP